MIEFLLEIFRAYTGKLCLANFNTWLQILIGFNLAYAGIDSFRKIIQNRTEFLGEIDEWLHEKLMSFCEKVKIKEEANKTSKEADKVKEGDRTKKYNKAIEELEKDFRGNLISINSALQKDFTQKFRFSFAITGVFSLFLLFLSAFESSPESFNYVLYEIPLLLASTYILTIFILSFFVNKEIDKPIKATYFYPFWGALIAILISIYIYNECSEPLFFGNEKLLILLCAILPLFPFMFLILREILKATYVLFVLILARFCGGVVRVIWLQLLININQITSRWLGVNS